MSTTDTPERAAFRAETSAWMKDNAPAALFGTRQGKFDGYWGGQREAPTPDQKTWMDVMVERGFTAPTWPTEYGGAGLSDDRGLVIHDEMARLKLPPALVGFGLVMIGPTLLRFGTESQKRRHLRSIARGEIRWCQGYSEPNSGSDLASLQCRAIGDGDEFVINGQKIWTSHADLSDWIFCLVRTNTEVKKQAGITFLLIDMNSPGVSVKQIKLISGSSIFCETFFDDVRVPLANIIGDIDGGWTVAKALLRFERSTIGEAMGGGLHAIQEDLVELARDHLDSPDGPLPDPFLRDEIVKAVLEERCFRFTIEQMRQSMENGQAPGLESSILKIAASELKQRRWDLATRIAGPAGLGWEGPGFEVDELDMTRQWLRSRGNTIEGGTSEIQLNILAKRVLGLPTK